MRLMTYALPLRPTLSLGEYASVSTPPSTQRVGGRKKHQKKQEPSSSDYLRWLNSQRTIPEAYGDPNKEVKTPALPVVEEKTQKELQKELQKEAREQRIRANKQALKDSLYDELLPYWHELAPRCQNFLEFCQNPPKELSEKCKQWLALRHR
jgi:hypothetical protein